MPPLMVRSPLELPLGGSGALTHFSGPPRLLTRGLHYTMLGFFVYTTTLRNTYASHRAKRVPTGFQSSSHTAESLRGTLFYLSSAEAWAALGRPGLEPLTTGATPPGPGGVAGGGGGGGQAGGAGGGGRAARGRCHCLGAVSSAAVGYGPITVLGGGEHSCSGRGRGLSARESLTWLPQQAGMARRYLAQLWM